MSDTRIRWSLEEWSKLDKKVRALFHGRVDSSIQLMNFVHSLAEAQKQVLPQERWRAIDSIDAVPTSVRLELFHDILPPDVKPFRRGAGKLQVESPLKSQIDQLQAQLGERTDELHVAHERVHQLELQLSILRARPEPLEMLQDWIAGCIRKAFAQAPIARPETLKVDPSQLEQRKEDLPAFEIERRKQINQGAPPPVVKPPKVLFVGGGAAYERTALPASQRFNGQIRASFFKEDGSTRHLQDLAKGADMTFILMGACSHMHVDAILSVTDRFQRVNGYSVDHLTNMVRNWLSSRKETHETPPSS